MKFTLSWLKEHLETSATLDVIVDTINKLGLEVEDVYDPAKDLTGFVVADVVTCEKHPQADRLSLCQVDDGSGALVQVVCGAPNVHAGMKVAFARIGQVIPSTGQPLKKGCIRGIESCGMLCSAQELKLGQDSNGILDLQTTLPAGAPLGEALDRGDPVVELSVTPNRSDCFSVRGIARDLAAAGLGTLKDLPYQHHQGQGKSPIDVKIQDEKACPYFVGRLIRGIKNGPSPAWMQKRLEAIGLRPISALVDITNYLTYDLGRPLHVFDAKKINGHITVRLAQAGETLTALDGKDYKLHSSMIVIADQDSPLALGGIIGGQNSSCTESTHDVFVECALFNPVRIAQTGQTLALISDARTRFERGVDPAAVIQGMEAATDLILSLCGGTPSDLVCAGTEPSWQKEIELTHDYLQGLSGCPITLVDAAQDLQHLGFIVDDFSSGRLKAQVPSWRPDVEGSADLVEEILRLRGYETIPIVPLEMPHRIEKNPDNSIGIKKLLAARGLQEVLTWTFISESLAKLFTSSCESLRLANPITQDLAIMRPSLLPSLLLAVSANQARGQSQLAFFEGGAQFQSDHHQREVICGLRNGATGQRHWSQETRSVDVFDIKADVFSILDMIGIEGKLEEQAPSYYHPGRSGSICQGPKILAHFGEIHPQILGDMDIKGNCVAFEVFLDSLPSQKHSKSSLTLSPYQAVERDFAFILDRNVPAEQVIKVIQRIDRQLIESVSIFDLYEGEKVPADKKSLAVQVRLQPLQATLTEADITSISEKIIASVTQTTGGVLRQA